MPVYERVDPFKITRQAGNFYNLPRAMRFSLTFSQGEPSVEVMGVADKVNTVPKRSSSMLNTKAGDTFLTTSREKYVEDMEGLCIKSV